MNVLVPGEMRHELDHPSAARVYQLADALLRHGEPVVLSQFWREQLEIKRPFITALQERSDGSIDRYRRKFGYGFEPSPGEAANGELDSALQFATEIRQALAGVNDAKSARGKALAEHIDGLLFLRNYRLLDEYRSDIGRLGVRSSLSTVRHWYYARWITSLAHKAGLGPQLRFLEIGAGAANLLVFLAQRGIVGSYTIVDIPHMLIQAGITCSTFFGSASVDITQGDNPVLLASPADLGAVRGKRFDVALNFNSFMEMDRDQIERYFRLIYATLRPGGMFINVNRRQRALPLTDGSTWDNNPLTYPYRSTDVVMRWEEDLFQTETRAWPGKMPSLAVARVALTPKRNVLMRSASRARARLRRFRGRRT